MYKIIENNRDFVLIDKSPGIGFHNEQGDSNGEVAGEVSKGVATQLKADLGMAELYPVHRLDKMTSGLLLFAKTKENCQQLVKQFEERMIEKYYLALSDNKPNKKQGLVKGDMTKARRGSWMLTRETTNPAVTQFMTAAVNDGQRLFIVKPSTGKTHQIRVALKSVGSPILGDMLYADKQQAKKCDRGYLHAYVLGFMLNNKHYRFSVLPTVGEYFLTDSFKQIMSNFSEPWLLPWPVLNKSDKKNNDST